MSLASIAALRRSGWKPSSVWVAVGDLPRRHIADRLLVHVRPADEPQFMDWRPLVGVRVDVFEIGSHRELFNRTLSAVADAGADICGVVDTDEVLGRNEKHVGVLVRIKEHLCT